MTGTPDDGIRASGTGGTGRPAGSGSPPTDPPPGVPPGDSGRRRWRERAARLRDRARERTRGWWPKVRPILAQFRWSDEPQPAVTIVDRRVLPAVLVPAQGQVYGFVVRTTFTWTSDSVGPELFGWYVDYFQAQASQRLHRIATRCARESPPHRPREAEIALHAAFTGDDALPWTYVRGEVVFTCEPDVSVRLDERVRRLLQPYWDQRIALECERDLDRRRAEYAEERQAREAAESTEADAPPSAGMPEALREDHPPHQRAGEAPPRAAEQRRRRFPPDSPVEQFTPLEPLLPPPPPRPPHPTPGRPPTPTRPGDRTPPRPGERMPTQPGDRTPRQPGERAPAQPGETSSGGPEHPEPPDG
ncbi:MULTISPECIES: hypothetical protein [Micromonospora]|uniref:hypothetical protein n=1 Tax=Micromonospora TaxID=1873 RepID=UPI0018F3E764|nr:MULTISPECIES: hypothetical protein [Micromonospora]